MIGQLMEVARPRAAEDELNHGVRLAQSLGLDVSDVDACRSRTRLRKRRSAAPRSSAYSAALEVRAEEVLGAGGRHCRRGADLQRERGRCDDLREAVDLAGAGAAHQLEPLARGRAAFVPPPTVPTSSPGKRIDACRPPSTRRAGAVRHRARADHAEILPGRREDRRDRRRRRERDRLHPGRDRAVRARPTRAPRDRRGRPEHSRDRLVGQRRLRDHRLAVARTGSTRTTASCRRPCSPRASTRSIGDGRIRQHVRHVQRVRVAGHHVRADGVAGRQAPEDVAHRPDDVRLHLAQDGVARELRRCRRRAANSRISATCSLDPARERQRIPRVVADEARRARDAVRDDVRAERRPTPRPPCAALHRRGQPAFGVRERNGDLLGGAAGLDDVAVLGELVLAERDLQLRDRDRDHGDARHRLRGLAYGARSTSRRGRAPLAARRSTRGRSCGVAGPPCRHSCVTSRRARTAHRRQGARSQSARRGRRGSGRARRRRADHGPRRRRPGLTRLHHRKQKAATAVGIEANDLRLPADTPEDELLAAPRRAERRRRRRRDPRPAAAARPSRRDQGHRGDRARRRTSTASTRSTPAACTSAARRSCRARRSASCACSRSTTSSPAGAHAVVIGRSDDRRQADGAPPAPGERDRDDLPFADARPRSATRSTRTSSSPRSGSLHIVGADMVKAGVDRDRRRHEPHRRRPLRRRRP